MKIKVLGILLMLSIALNIYLLRGTDEKEIVKTASLQECQHKQPAQEVAVHPTKEITAPRPKSPNTSENKVVDKKSDYSAYLDMENPYDALNRFYEEEGEELAPNTFKKYRALVNEFIREEQKITSKFPMKPGQTYFPTHEEGQKLSKLNDKYYGMLKEVLGTELYDKHQKFKSEFNRKVMQEARESGDTPRGLIRL